MEGYTPTPDCRNSGLISVVHSNRGLSVDEKSFQNKTPREFYNQNIGMINQINKLIKQPDFGIKS